MDPFEALSHMPELVADYKAMATRVIEAEKELVALRSDRFVTIDWVAHHWDVDPDTARKMLKVLASGPKRTEIKVLSFGPKIVRYRRSDIELITENSLVSLRELLAQKRAVRQQRNPV